MCSYTNEYPTGRYLRDAKLYEIGAGTSGEACRLRPAVAAFATARLAAFATARLGRFMGVLSVSAVPHAEAMLPNSAEIRRILIGRELFKESAP